jgi:hypothetical protein
MLSQIIDNQNKLLLEKGQKIKELEKELEQAKKVQVVEHFEAYGQCRDSRRIVSLEKENEELKDKLNNLASVAEVRLANWQKYEKENKELKALIDKMKCCGNCIHEINEDEIIVQTGHCDNCFEFCNWKLRR